MSRKIILTENQFKYSMSNLLQEELDKDDVIDLKRTVSLKNV